MHNFTSYTEIQFTQRAWHNGEFSFYKCLNSTAFIILNNLVISLHQKNIFKHQAFTKIGDFHGTHNNI
jgi:hypothetical protein